jgi:hypothetical protein
MPTSDKRVAANRANAGKSTGPRTPEGKDRSRLNAVSPGLTAQTSVLPGEDRSELEELSASLMRQLDPRGVLQRLVAERIVSLAWKLRRVARAEEAIATEMDERVLDGWKRGRRLAAEQPIFRQFVKPRPRERDAGALLADATWVKGEVGSGHHFDPRLQRITQYELKLDAALRAAVRELRALKKEERFDEEEEAPQETPPSENKPHAPADAGEKVTEAPRAGGESDAARNEATVEKTNPTPAPDETAQVGAATDVAAENRDGSSAPAPGTSACPPPGPRR